MGFLQLLAAIIHLFGEIGAPHAHFVGPLRGAGQGIVETKHWIITIRPR
jgi:hypothetical protein